MRIFFILALGGATLFGCGEGKNDAPAAAPDTLAIAAGHAITQADFDNAAQGLDGEMAAFIKTPSGRESFINYLINEALLQKAAQINQITATQEYRQEMAAFASAQARALSQKRDMLTRELLLKKLEQDGIITVSEDEIRAYHRKFPYQIVLAHILLGDAQKAAEVMREAKSARTLNRFGEYARRFSIDEYTKKNNGVMEAFIPGEYLPEIEVPAANTPALNPQGFIKTMHGFHIIMKVREERLTYNAAKDRIKNILEKQKLDAYLNSLRQEYGAEVINDEQ